MRTEEGKGDGKGMRRGMGREEGKGGCDEEGWERKDGIGRDLRMTEEITTCQ